MDMKLQFMAMEPWNTGEQDTKPSNFAGVLFLGQPMSQLRGWIAVRTTHLVEYGPWSQSSESSADHPRHNCQPWSASVQAHARDASFLQPVSLISTNLNWKSHMNISHYTCQKHIIFIYILRQLKRISLAPWKNGLRVLYSKWSRVASNVFSIMAVPRAPLLVLLVPRNQCQQAQLWLS